GETFTAAEGMGAWLDGRRLEVSGTRELGSALLVTGFPYDLRQHPRVTLDLFGDFCLAAQGVRRDGAAALDLCYVAAGRFDAMWEVGLSPWDMAAGSLIVREAGGMVTDMKGRPADVRTREMVASNVHLHRAMLDIIEPHLAALRASPYWRD
ncbi:MAG TPA: inositol monophosphatase family protein, partial [Candidatus Nitrosotenuis sp.]|nr:inositol monophosphatase family protein [Candidatus Nitrosotenuis sp.]